VLSPAESCPTAKAAGFKALEIDADLADAHTALGWIKMTCDWDRAGTEREFKRALEINPNDWTARQWYAVYFKRRDGWKKLLPRRGARWRWSRFP
jgi:hypothetical protein